MRILALGGTQFVGRAFVEAALGAGHEVTVLHRGNTPLPEGWGAGETLADRDGGLDALGDRAWDAVYDSCGYVPRIVRQSVEALADRCCRYLFVSTISVFDFELNLQRPERPLETEVIDGDTYGPLKVECEDVVTGAFADRATVVRPGLVIGPHDHTGRFAYWVNRFAMYGEVLVPDVAGWPMQLIDARDLASFTLRLLEQDQPGTFHAAGEPSTFGAMIAACASVGGGEAVRVPIEVLEAHGVRPGVDLPLVWGQEASKLLGIGCEESLAVGLQRRALRESTADTLSWLLSLADKRPVGAWPRDEEERVLAALRA